MKQQLINRLTSNRKILFLLILILLLGGFLRLYRLSELMLFFADPGWFYWSAKKMLIDGQIPLVGIASSHTWIHQGAAWTYILGFILFLFNSNPFAPAYFIAILGIFTVLLIYYISKEMFSEKVGLISAFIYATSPLVVHDSRLAYHTSPIPTLTLLFIYSIYKWLKGNVIFFPISVFLAALLYNFEIATFSLIGALGLIFLYGLFKKRKWFLKLKNKKIFSYSVIGFIVPMIPMLIHDLHNGFPQTLKFVVWVFYRLAVILGFPPIHEVTGENWRAFSTYNIEVLKHLIFVQSGIISLLIVSLSVILFLFINRRSILKNKLNVSDSLIFLFVLIPTLAFLSQRTNSGAYLLMLFPQWIIFISLVAGYLMKDKIKQFIILTLIVLIGLSNSIITVRNNFFVTININDYFSTAKKIIHVSKNKPFNVLAKGQGSQYESFITPYKYILWYLGKPASENNEKLKFYVSEETGKIELEVKN